MDLVVEAVRSIGLACSATVVVPTVLVTVASGGRRWPAATAVVGAILGTFVTVAWAPLIPDPLHGTVLGGAFLGAALTDRVSWTAPRRAVATAASTLVAGVAAGLLWQPCVGPELGDVLTSAVRSPWPEFPSLAVYAGVLATPGAALSAWLVGRGHAATTAGPARWARAAQWAAVALGLVLAATVTAGLGDELTAALYRWSR